MLEVFALKNKWMIKISAALNSAYLIEGAHAQLQRGNLLAALVELGGHRRLGRVSVANLLDLRLERVGQRAPQAVGRRGEGRVL